MQLRHRRFVGLPRFDFTPFVAVGFILITFFVWLKQLQRDGYMVLDAPHGCRKVDAIPVKLRVFLFLLADNQLGVLICRPDTVAAEYYETQYSAATVRRLLVFADRLYPGLPLVVIKPTAQSTFKNMVDVLDDFRFAPSIRYLFVDQLTPGEQELIKNYARYRLACLKRPQQQPIRLYRWR